MSEFRIFETREFIQTLSKLPPKDGRLLRIKIESHVYPQLRQEPFLGPNIKKLRGYSPNTWRYRLGRFRLFYAVNDKELIVLVLTVEQRKDAYR